MNNNQGTTRALSRPPDTNRQLCRNGGDRSRADRDGSEALRTIGAALEQCWDITRQSHRQVLQRTDEQARRVDQQSPPDDRSTTRERTSATAPPIPQWRQAGATLLALYPTVLTADVVIGPLARDLPRFLGVLASVVVVVIAMTYVMLPAVARLLRATHPHAEG